MFFILMCCVYSYIYDLGAELISNTRAWGMRRVRVRLMFKSGPRYRIGVYFCGKIAREDGKVLETDIWVGCMDIGRVGCGCFLGR